MVLVMLNENSASRKELLYTGIWHETILTDNKMHELNVTGVYRKTDPSNRFKEL